MKKTLWICAISSAGLLMLSLLLKWESAFPITFGTIFYHFAMRLVIGSVVPRVSVRSAWFRERKWERRLYAALRVRSWKDRIPSYDPREFDLQHHAMEEILANMCRAEAVHEIIALLSFLPLCAIPRFGEPLVFSLTSLLAALFDLLFVILQRFNRPRVETLLRRQKKNTAKH